MKLTNEQIRMVNNAYVYLSNVETAAWLPICTNVIELEAHVKKVDKFLGQVAEKLGCLSEDKARVEYKSPDQKKDFEAQTADYMKKSVEIKLEIIKKSQLEGLKIPGSLIMGLVKLKLIV